MTQNHPESLLKVWTLLEILLPKTYDKAKDVLAIPHLSKVENILGIKNLKNHLSWTLGKEIKMSDQQRKIWQFDEYRWPKHKDILEKDQNSDYQNKDKNSNRQNKVVLKTFHCIFLYALDMDRVNDDLIQKFSDDHNPNRLSKQKGVIAVIVLDENKLLQKPDLIEISSFAWAYPKILDGQFGFAHKWFLDEAQIKSKIVLKIEQLIKDQRDTFPKCLMELSSWLAKELNIDSHHLHQCCEVVSVIREFDIKSEDKEQNAPLLNSFYLKDLRMVSTLVEQNQANVTLQKLLGIRDSDFKVDVLKDRKILQRTLSPKSYSQSRWPSDEKHGLVMLQQTAIQLSSEELKDAGIFAVNGPPGTGKTTLVRDMFASIIVERAKQMVTFDNPNDAFTLVEKGSRSKENYDALNHEPNPQDQNDESQTTDQKTETKYNVYKLDPKITGYEILVASSNNAAVENISRELPSRAAVGDGMQDFEYFNLISQALSKDDPTWGMISATLGKGKNQRAFRDKFWFDRDIGLLKYCEFIRRKEVYVNDKDKLDQDIKRTPKIVSESQPPGSRAEAQVQWRQTIAKFQTCLNQVDQKLNTLDTYNTEFLHLLELKERLEKNKQLILEWNQSLKDYHTRLSGAKDLVYDYERMKGRAHNKIKDRRSKRPWFFYWIVKRSVMKSWYVEKLKLQQKRDQINAQLSQAEQDFERIENEKRTLHCYEAQEKDLLIQIDQSRDKLQTLYEKMAQTNLNFKAQLSTELFWQQDHAGLQKFVLWLDEDLQQARSLVFKAALDVHKAFLGAAVNPIFCNLQMLFTSVIAGVSNQQARDNAMHLWQTLFLIVPVISSTLASIEKMFKDLPPESLGWCFIDEAGQATPQSALGLMARTKRAFVLGDPMQIPPVVTLNLNIIHTICQEFNVDAQSWAAPLTSLQACADRASKYGTTIKRDTQSLWIGAPLLVHRRCDDPMFSISNAIAYDNLMVSSVVPRASRIKDILGQTHWIDIKGTSEDKWCEEEGIQVVKMLHALYQNGIQNPNVYIISPFSIVSANIKKMLRAADFMKRMITGELDGWIGGHVGTVHTFQGKEAEAVIMVLGAQTESGARNWVSQSPNILNVAVSRAKCSLYVVGNHTEWQKQNYFRKMDLKVISSMDTHF